MEVNSNELEMFTFNQIKDEFIGEIGTEKRTRYEQELQLEALGEMIRKVRLERRLTQEELGKLVGVQRAQISKLENNTTNVTLETILRVFSALKARVNFDVELMNNQIKIAQIENPIAVKICRGGYRTIKQEGLRMDKEFEFAVDEK